MQERHGSFALYKEEPMFSSKESEMIPCYSFIFMCYALELSSMIGASGRDLRRKTN